ncbi:MAG TPA: diguanylate cyclase [Bacillota bacterium]|nr:diguanylate cyclase [Bacillota bacterium]
MRRKITAAVVFLALLPTILIGLAINYYSQSTIHTEYLKVLAGAAHITDVHLTEYYNFIIDDTRKKAERDAIKSFVLSAKNPGGIKYADRGEAQRILTEPTGFPLVSGTVIDESGKTVYSSRPGEEGRMLDQTELYRSIMGGADSYIGLAAIDDSSDMLEVAVPINDGQNGIIGILKQNVNMDFLYDFLSSLNLGRSGEAFLIRGDGYMIFDGGRENSMFLYHKYQDNDSLNQLISAFRGGSLKGGKGTIEFESKGAKMIGAYELVEPFDSIAVATMEQDEIFEDIKRVREVYITAALCVMAVIALFGHIIGGWYAAPIRMANSVLSKIANGDLSARCGFGRRDEWGTLFRNINHLADGYQKDEKSLRMSSRIDGLTRLPNCAAIFEVLDTLLYKHPNQALMLLNIEDLQEINDNLGFDIGEKVLVEIGDILRKLPQNVCYPARLVGAEFLIFLTNWTKPRYPEMIAAEIIEKAESIRFIDEIHVDIGVSIGIEYTGEERLDKRKLIKHCNLARQRARSTGKSACFVYFSSQAKES